MNKNKIVFGILASVSLFPCFAAAPKHKGILNNPLCLSESQARFVVSAYQKAAQNQKEKLDDSLGDLLRHCKSSSIVLAYISDEEDSGGMIKSIATIQQLDKKFDFEEQFREAIGDKIAHKNPIRTLNDSQKQNLFFKALDNFQRVWIPLVLKRSQDY